MVRDLYLPKLRDRVVLETAIRDALAKLDPKFAYSAAAPGRGDTDAGAGSDTARRRSLHAGASKTDAINTATGALLWIG
jgi:hypothetical protein